MQLPPEVEHLPYNWWTDRGGMGICAIIGHGTAGTDSRAYLSRGGDKPDGSDRKVSIHVLIRKDGKQYRYVPDERGANHAGASTARLAVGGKTFHGGAINQVTLGFELENLQDGRDPYTDPQLLSLGHLIATWRKRHGNLPIFRHGDLDPTRRRDPYQLSVQDIEMWTARALARMQPTKPIGTYRVKGVPVYQRSDGTGPVAGYLKSDDVVEIDATYPQGTGHLASGLGFVDMDCFE